MTEPVGSSNEPLIDPREPPTDSGVVRAPAVVGRPGRVEAVGELRDVKETYANRIAQIITWTFAASALLILIGLYAILRNHPSDAEGLLMKAGIPALKEIGLFLSSVFGPLLAFVLGYYFGERKSVG